MTVPKESRDGPWPRPVAGRLAFPAADYPGIDPDWVRLWNEHGGGMVRADEVSIERYRESPAQYSFTYPTCRGTHAKERSEGGWVLGGLNSEAAWCRHICNKANIKVIDVDYRMGPEFKFPTAIYDCWDTVKWAVKHAAALNIDSSSVSFGGLSAGGQMSAVLAHFARDEHVAIKLHLMIVPATDMRYCRRRIEQLDESNCPYESARLYRDLPWGPLGREQWFLKYWLGDDDDEQERLLDDWRLTPVLAPDLSNLPPAHIVTAEFDLERDEGEHYGRLLRDAGNRVSMKRYAGVPHAFAHFNHPERGLARSFEFIDDTAGLLRAAHYGDGA
ncbi:Arylesterase [Colletotrichum higginsianum]|uniref:Arylesterase n=1 Tax=Colletotrichum higginsianum TaxID=80884 RepID=A0A4V4NE03_9PEZI|nr:Arylesterase [Colletotrichum higginsianum]